MAMTIEEALKQILSDDEKKAALQRAVKTGGTAACCDYIRSLGVEATDGEIAGYAESLANDKAELLDEDLGAVSGGSSLWKEALLSVFTIGCGCAIAAVTSLVGGNTDGEEQSEDDEAICNFI